MAKREFQTEVNQLLQLIIHSLYSHPEIFLRELVSNASDALDKLKYLTLTEEPYKSLAFDPRIDLELDEVQHTLTVSDTGIGMNEEDLVAHLGTIARSGTKNFLSSLSGDAKRDSNLIGQFGVGLLQRLHGGGPGGSGLAESRRRAGLALDQRRQERLRNRTGRARLSKAPRSRFTSTKKARNTPTAGSCARSSRSIPTTSRSRSSSPPTRASGTRPRRSRSRSAPPSRSIPPARCGSAPRAN